MARYIQSSKYLSVVRQVQPKKSSGKRGYDARWRRIRTGYLRRHPMCEVEGCNELATDVDHKDGNVTNCVDDNLQSLCHSCHAKKSVACDGGFGRGKRR